MKLLIVTGFCELIMCIEKLHRGVEESVQPQGSALQGHSGNTNCCKGAAREALGALLKRRICLRNLIQQIPGLWAEVKAFLEPNTKVFCVGRCRWC